MQGWPAAGPELATHPRSPPDPPTETENVRTEKHIRIPGAEGAEGAEHLLQFLLQPREKGHSQEEQKSAVRNF